MLCCGVCFDCRVFLVIETVTSKVRLVCPACCYGVRSCTSSCCFSISASGRVCNANYTCSIKVNCLSLDNCSACRGISKCCSECSWHTPRCAASATCATLKGYCNEYRVLCCA